MELDTKIQIDSPEVKGFNNNRKKWLKESWIRSIGTEDFDQLNKRLEWDNLSWDRAYDLLESTITPIDNNTRFQTISDWVRHFSEAPEQTVNNNFDQSLQEFPFAHLWVSVCEGGIQELKQRIGNQVKELSDLVYASLSRHLLKTLCQLSEYVLWYEFDNCRTAGEFFLAQISENPNGKTNQQRYLQFIKELQQDGLRQLCKKYPLLTEYLSSIVDAWMVESEKLLIRLTMDDAIIKATYKIHTDAQLFLIEQGLGDSHRQGQTVSKIVYTINTQSWSVIYKPRDMRIDKAYHDFIQKIPPTPNKERLNPLTTLAFDGYGYTNYVSHVPCKSPKEFEDFYHYSGRLSAVLHVLGCTDCHYSNLIANGTKLFLIDTETLFEGRIKNSFQLESDQKEVSPLGIALEDSVIRTGLIPQWSFGGKNNEAYDVSAFGIQYKDQNKVEKYTLISLNNDAMEYKRVHKDPGIFKCLPVSVNKKNPFEDYIEHFCQGFTDQMNTLHQVRHQLLGEDGWLQSFSGLPRRIVLRSTKVYYSILEQLCQPEAMRSHLHKTLVLEKLARAFLSEHIKPLSWQIFKSEVAQFQKLDIPFFSHQLDSRDLPFEGEEQIIEGFLEQTGMELASNKLQSISSETITFQIDLIKSVTSSKQLRVIDTTNAIKLQLSTEDNSHFSRKRYLKEVSTLAGHILEKAHWTEDGRIEWLGLKVGPDALRTKYMKLDASLYDGYSGIVLFLNAASQFESPQKELLKKASRAAVLPLLNILESNSSNQHRNWWLDKPFGLCGTSGILLALNSLINSLQYDQELFQNGLSKLSRNFPVHKIRQCENPDILNGLAGSVGIFTHLMHEGFMELAEEAGDRLVSLQQPDGSWCDNSRSSRSLCGFAHGSSGVISALSKLYSLTKKASYKSTIDKGLDYERLLFDKNQKNWPDLRFTDEFKFTSGWCNGSSGMALSRICLMQSGFKNDQLLKELDYALHAIVNQQSGTDRLCCGHFGRSIVLKMAAEALNDDSWKIEASRIEQNSIISKSNNQHYKLFSNMSSEMMNPSLFVGHAGIGMSLLQSTNGHTGIEQIISCGLIK